jgi:hypothetical protein
MSNRMENPVKSKSDLISSISTAAGPAAPAGRSVFEPTILDEPDMQIEYDEKGNEHRVYYQSSAHLRTTWRPREGRE